MKQLIFLLLLLISSKIIAQEKVQIVFSGKDYGNVPFAQVTIDGVNFLSDVNGKIELEQSQQSHLVQHPYFESQTFFTNTSKTISLKSKNQERLKSSDLNALKTISALITKRAQLNLQENTSYNHYNYNKLVFTSDSIERVKDIVKSLTKGFNINIDTFQKPHHILLMESLSRKEYKDDLNQEEIILHSKVSGVENPSIYTISSAFQNGSIFNNYVRIISQFYLSPFNDRALKHYYFKTSSEVNLKNGSKIQIIEFSPKYRNANSLRGILYIDSKNLNLIGYTIAPAFEKAYRIAQSFEETSENKFYPKTTRTDFYVRLKRNEIPFEVQATSDVYDLNITTYTKPFSNIILRYQNEAIAEKEFPKSRQRTYSKKDANTYEFYKQVGNLKKFEKIANLGEGLLSGKIPYQQYNFETDKLININEYEGLRIGLGVHTNDLFSKDFMVGGYWGFGLNDSKLKAGAKGAWKILPEEKLVLKTAFFQDVLESGGQSFTLDKYQYNTEHLRKFLLRIMDKVTELNVVVASKPMKYVDFSAGLSKSLVQPTYEYTFTGDTTSRFNFSELQLGLKLGYGEKYIKTESNTFFAGSAYPTIWLQFHKGFDRFAGGEFSYSKLDLKAYLSYRIVGFGKSSVQVSVGLTQGDLPYYKLYNMRGSLRNLSVVTHNSFETMQYNEFLSNRFFAIFYSHDFGRYSLPFLNLTPGFLMLHNYGFGILTDKAMHLNIPFKTMEKGYFESGFYINDLFSQRIVGIKAALGAGFFYRYGPYSAAIPGDNLVFKLAFTVSP